MSRLPRVLKARLGDGEVDGTTSGSSVDSTQVNDALLAGESQHTRYNNKLTNPRLGVHFICCPAPSMGKLLMFIDISASVRYSWEQGLCRH